MKKQFKAAIFDLDGVITQTAVLHAKSWKMMFDEYNKLRKNEGRKDFEPFSDEEDYSDFIDGMPRESGVRNFLKSRNIEIPEGKPSDQPGKESIYGLGNLKNNYYLELLKDGKIEILEENVERVKEWRSLGMKTAIVSSSKNCKEILKATGLEDLFDVRVDGKISEERNIPGKPAPDIFLSAAEELGVKPQDALVVEDSKAGVEAGKKGNFALVVGIEYNNNKNELLKRGADVVVKNLGELEL